LLFILRSIHPYPPSVLFHFPAPAAPSGLVLSQPWGPGLLGYGLAARASQPGEPLAWALKLALRAAQPQGPTAAADPRAAQSPSESIHGGAEGGSDDGGGGGDSFQELYSAEQAGFGGAPGACYDGITDGPGGGSALGAAAAEWPAAPRGIAGAAAPLEAGYAGAVAVGALPRPPVIYIPPLTGTELLARLNDKWVRGSGRVRAEGRGGGGGLGPRGGGRDRVVTAEVMGRCDAKWRTESQEPGPFRAPDVGCQLGPCGARWWVLLSRH
jgi:hypothetical protein